MKKQVILFALTGICTLCVTTGFSIKELVNLPVLHAKKVTANADYTLYVGEYQMNPKKVLTISVENNRLFGEPTGEPKVELHPESEHVFTIKEFKGKVTFILDTTGTVTQAVINLQNKDMVAKKLDKK